VSATASIRLAADVVGRTVRLRTTVTALLVVGTSLVITAAALLLLLHRSMERNVDAQARLRLSDVAALAERGELPPTLAGADDGTVAQVVAGGRVLAQSPIIHGPTPLAVFVPPGGRVAVRTVKDPPIGDGGPYRVAVREVSAPGGPIAVYAAATLEPVDEAMRDLGILLVVAVPGLVLLVGVTTWGLVGRTLEPVEAIRREVAEISSTALGRRVPVPGTADEIDRLARTMNEMLDRLDGAARRQRTFIADAAHELRSPLATVRTTLEVALARPTGVDWSELARGWLAQQHRLAGLVDDLLLLARLDEGAPGQRRNLVDLDELVLREAEDIRARGRVRIDLSGVEGGRVRGDGPQLRRVVANLLDNAERHAAGTVAVELRRYDGVVELVVGDDGPGIAAAQRQRVFERFVRIDEARTRGGGGAGLGLAIVRDIVSAHGGVAEAVDAHRGARLVVRLPAADGGTASGDRATAPLLAEPPSPHRSRPGEL
jgi:signal transduction histidine kinase